MPPCALRREAEAFINSIDLQGLEGRLSGTHDRCYCERCYKAQWPSTLNNEGPTPYVIPRGWFRFSLSLDPAAFGTLHRQKVPDFDQDEMFSEWSASFHGVKSLEVLRGILKLGKLLKPGDRRPDGTIVRSTKTSGRQQGVFYTSPTVKYAGLKFYAEPQPYGNDGMAALSAELRGMGFRWGSYSNEACRARVQDRAQGWFRSLRRSLPACFPHHPHSSAGPLAHRCRAAARGDSDGDRLLVGQPAARTAGAWPAPPQARRPGAR